MPIFRVKSVKIYTGPKKFTRASLVGSWQIWGMCVRTENLLLACQRCGAILRLSVLVLVPRPVHYQLHLGKEEHLLMIYPFCCGCGYHFPWLLIINCNILSINQYPWRGQWTHICGMITIVWPFFEASCPNIVCLLGFEASRHCQNRCQAWQEHCQCRDKVASPGNDGSQR